LGANVTLLVNWSQLRVWAGTDPGEAEDATAPATSPWKLEGRSELLRRDPRDWRLLRIRRFPATTADFGLEETDVKLGGRVGSRWTSTCKRQFRIFAPPATASRPSPATCPAAKGAHLRRIRNPRLPRW